MPHYAAFHLGLHCLPKNPFRGFLVLKGLNFHADVSKGDSCLNFGRRLHLHPYFVHASMFSDQDQKAPGWAVWSWSALNTILWHTVNFLKLAHNKMLSGLGLIICLSWLQRGGGGGRHWSDCFFSCSLVWVCTICFYSSIWFDRVSNGLLYISRGHRLEFQIKLYSKTVWNGHSQKDQKLVFKTNYHWMQVVVGQLINFINHWSFSVNWLIDR